MDQAQSGQHRRELSPAPPPTPIARAVGKKSTTHVNDRTLSAYLAKSLTVPDLYLPESRRLSREERLHPRPLVCVDFASNLVNNEVASRVIIEAAKDLGTFQIVGHNISAQETRSAMEGVKEMFLTHECIKDEGNMRESLKYTIRRSITYPEATNFSNEVENIFGKIERVSEELGQVLFKNNQPLKNSGEKEAVDFWFHKYYHENNMSYMTHTSAIGRVEPNPAYRLHFQLGNSELHVQCRESYKSFKTESGSIIVTMGKGVKDWSDEYKSFPWEPILISEDNKPSFVLECMCYRPVSDSNEHNADTKFISITDQMFISVTFIILYKFLAFIAYKFLTSLI